MPFCILLAAYGILSSQGRGQRSAYEPIVLNSAVLEDPFVIDYLAGGTVDARSLYGGRCFGFINHPQPDHVLEVPSAVGFARLSVSSEADTTLVVLDSSDGSVLYCDDDSGGGRDPEVRGGFPAGRYEIYVGTYSRVLEYPSYSLTISFR